MATTRYSSTWPDEIPEGATVNLHAASALCGITLQNVARACRLGHVRATKAPTGRGNWSIDLASLRDFQENRLRRIAASFGPRPPEAPVWKPQG